jgi:hypothetical protein
VEAADKDSPIFVRASSSMKPFIRFCRSKSNRE